MFLFCLVTDLLCGLEFRLYAVPSFPQWLDSMRFFYLLVIEKGVRSLKLRLQYATHDGSLCYQAALPPWLRLQPLQFGPTLRFSSRFLFESSLVP